MLENSAVKKKSKSNSTPTYTLIICLININLSVSCHLTEEIHCHMIDHTVAFELLEFEAKSDKTNDYQSDFVFLETLCEGALRDISKAHILREG